MKIVLAGSPDLTLEAFEKIINNFEVVAIITQPDRPQGRNLKVKPTPVSELGLKYGIKVFKFDNIKKITNELRELKFDLLLTFAFGQYIPAEILDLGSYRPLNIHGSILPKYRGAAPIQYAILNGDQEIGISLIEMTSKMDAGDIYFVDKIKIDKTTTSEQGFKIISDLATKNIVEWLKKVKINQVNPWTQSDNFTLSPKITKEMANLSLELTVEQAIRKIRAFNPFPGAFLMINNKRLKVFNVSNKTVKNSIILHFSDGDLWINDWQWEGKKRQQLH